MPKTDLVSPPSHCALCPRRCGVDRAAGAVGFCGAGRTLKAARAALHFWEEPCISGTHGSGTVFFSGCTLKCCFCQNYPISAEGLGKEITVERLAEIFLDLQAQGAHNINLVTPGQWRPWIIAALDLARAQGIIKGYKTLVDWEKAGVNRVEAVIELNVSPKKSRGFDEIAATIAAFDEVESVLLMSGGYDLQLVIKGQTFQEIALFVAKRLSPLDDVLSTATHFVLRTYKKEGRLYQDDEIDERECTVL